MNNEGRSKWLVVILASAWILGSSIWVLTRANGIYEVLAFGAVIGLSIAAKLFTRRNERTPIQSIAERWKDRSS